MAVDELVELRAMPRLSSKTKTAVVDEQKGPPTFYHYEGATVGEPQGTWNALTSRALS